MMYFLEITGLCLGACMCILCSNSDMREGIIYNKIIVVFLACAVVIDSAYYGFFVQDLLLNFILNMLVVMIVSLYLFFSHSFAGGDCKMTIVLAMLYPARCYLSYGSSSITLVFAIAFAIFAGYIFLLVRAVYAIITKKVKITYAYIKSSILNFAKSFISAMAYIALFNCMLMIFDRCGIDANVWLSRCFCLLIAWCVGRFSALKRNVIFLPVIALVVAISIILKTTPISVNPENYILVVVLLLCQMTIKSTLYEKKPVDQLKKGMILSTLSSVLMQSSITKGLPGVSTEDLKSRLSSEEIDSIVIWAKATHTEELTVVKKIPFGIFISIGFLSYFVIWSIAV